MSESGPQPEPVQQPPASRWDSKDSLLVGLGLGIGLLTALPDSAEGRALSGASDRLARVLVNGIAWATVFLIVRNAARKRWKMLLLVGLGGPSLAIGSFLAIVKLEGPRVRQAHSRMVVRAPPVRSQAASLGWEGLTKAEQARLEGILVATLRDPSFPPKEVHAELWTLIDKMAGAEATPEQVDLVVRPLRVRLTAVSLDYQTLFWQDAQASVATHGAVKSRDRAAYEEQLVRDGFMSDSQARQNDRLIEDFAAGRAVSVPGGSSTVFTSERIILIKASLKATAGRLDRLLTRPRATPDDGP